MTDCVICELIDEAREERSAIFAPNGWKILGVSAGLARAWADRKLIELAGSHVEEATR